MLGAIIGSFLATIIVRWPKGESVVSGRSRCDGCNASLRIHELVPLVSYLASRGRCRRCDDPIDPAHFIVEILAAAIGAISFVLFPGVEGLIGALLGWALLVLAVLDVRHFWLPDLIVLPLILVGLLAAFWLVRITPLESAIGAGVGFATLFGVSLLYRAIRGREGLGLGDAKLFAAAGAWLGWAMLPFVLLGASGLALLVVGASAVFGRRIAATQKIPLGAFLAAVIWPIWLFGESIRAALG